MVLSSATKISHFLSPLISSENDSFTTKSRLPNDEFTIQIRNHTHNRLSNMEKRYIFRVSIFRQNANIQNQEEYNQGLKIIKVTTNLIL